MHVLLIAPYFGGSHRAWAEGYARHSAHRVELLTLPARFWKWRMQGGAATLADRAQPRARAQAPDVLLVTDMLNLPAFLGLTRDVFGAVPVAMYCHENQLTYPVQPGERRDLTYAMINWLSMLAADRVCFNSAYHRDDWFAALPRLLKHFPDFTHMHRVPAVRARAQVLPVGCDLARLDRAEVPTRDAEAPPLILWNQRWEYDKDPPTFFRALDALAEAGVAFRVALAGANVRQQPEEFEAARRRLGARVVHYGRADPETYARLLLSADVVVSTARHEFFGIAVVEAIYGGCFPVLPRRLVYPELLPASAHDRCLYADVDGLVARLRWALTHRARAGVLAAELRPSVARFDWGRMAPRYDALLAELAGR
jgi:glycosyltransferase involved in cell wall biosynthesis